MENKKQDQKNYELEVIEIHGYKFVKIKDENGDWRYVPAKNVIDGKWNGSLEF